MTTAKVFKARNLLVLALVLCFVTVSTLCPVSASIVVNDDGMSLYSVDVFYSVTDSGTPVWTQPSTYSVTLNSDGSFRVSFNLTSGQIGGHVYRVGYRFSYFDSNLNTYRSFSLDDYTMSVTIGRVATSNSSWAVNGNHLSSYADGYNPMFLMSYVRQTGSSAFSGIQKAGGLGLNNTRTFRYSYSETVQVSNGIWLQWEGFDAFGDITLNADISLSINGSTAQLYAASDNLVKLADDLAVPLPTINPNNVLGDAWSGLDSSSANTNIFAVFYDNSIIPKMMLIAASCALIGYIFFGKRGGADA